MHSNVYFALISLLLIRLIRQISKISSKLHFPETSSEFIVLQVFYTHL